MYFTLRHPLKVSRIQHPLKMRYKVGSARVTRLARSTHLLAGTGVFYSSRIRVKGLISNDDPFTLPGLFDPLSTSNF